MMIKRQIYILILMSLVLLVWPYSPIEANWRANELEQALEYAQKHDRRSKTEAIIILWLAPQIVPPLPKHKQAIKLLKKNLLIGIVHVDLLPAGKLNFRPAEPPVMRVETLNPSLRHPLSEAQITPEIISGLVEVRNLFKRALGIMGKGTRWYIFKAQGIKPCKKGAFVIVYADKQYKYDLPVPGC